MVFVEESSFNVLRIVITSAIVAVTPVNMVPQNTAAPSYERNSERSSEEDMAHKAKEFFMEFERANASSDTTAIGSLYADSFMFAGPKGVQAVKKDDFLRILPSMKMQLSAMGCSATKLRTVETKVLDTKYLLATVVWKMVIGDPADHKSFDASATYVLLRGQGDALSIVIQIDHQDLKESVQANKAHGLASAR